MIIIINCVIFKSRLVLCSKSLIAIAKFDTIWLSLERKKNPNNVLKTKKITSNAYFDQKYQWKSGISSSRMVGCRKLFFLIGIVIVVVSLNFETIDFLEFHLMSTWKTKNFSQAHLSESAKVTGDLADDKKAKENKGSPKKADPPVRIHNYLFHTWIVLALSDRRINENVVFLIRRSPYRVLRVQLYKKMSVCSFSLISFREAKQWSKLGDRPILIHQKLLTFFKQWLR